MRENSPGQAGESLATNLAELEARIQSCTTDFTAFFKRAKLYLALKKHKEALQDLDLAIALQRKWPEAWVLRAETFAFLRDYDAAFVNYEVAIKLDSRRPATYWSRARLYEYLALHTPTGKSDSLFFDKNVRMALLDYSTALRLEPSNRSYIRARARLFRELGDYKAALLDYNYWLEIEPEASGPLQERAELLARFGQNPAALADYNQLLKINPTSQLYEKRGLLYKAMGEYKAALEDVSMALELGSDSPQQKLALHQNRADIMRQLRMRRETIKELRQVLLLEEQLFGSSAVTQHKIQQLEQMVTDQLQPMA